jgi:hypothetical protein
MRNRPPGHAELDINEVIRTVLALTERSCGAILYRFGPNFHRAAVCPGGLPRGRAVDGDLRRPRGSIEGRAPPRQATPINLA